MERKTARNLVMQNQATIISEEFTAYFMRYFEQVCSYYNEFVAFPANPTADFMVFLYNPSGEYVGSVEVHGIHYANELWKNLHRVKGIDTAMEVMGI